MLPFIGAEIPSAHLMDSLANDSAGHRTRLMRRARFERVAAVAGVAVVVAADAVGCAVAVD